MPENAKLGTITLIKGDKEETATVYNFEAEALIKSGAAKDDWKPIPVKKIAKQEKAPVKTKEEKTVTAKDTK